MATIRKHRARWRVQWIADGKRAQTSFAAEAEAVEFAAETEATRRGRRGGAGPRPRSREEVLNALAAKFEVDSSSDCWLWTGTTTLQGYARINWKPADRNISGGHRVVLAALGLPLPDGLVVDHLCRNRACINPDHLEMVTSRENIMRSPIAFGALNAAKTHCAKGHEYTPENTYHFTLKCRKTTGRQCRTCLREYRARRAAEQRVSA